MRAKYLRFEDAERQSGVVVAMSGGVDSTAAAMLLKEAGFRVVGLTMRNFCFGDIDLPERSCCSLEAIGDARRVCDKLGIAHQVMDVEEQFTSEVIENFLSEYRRSRTPNPCIRCNTCIRFQSLTNLADRIGFRYVATGHYARICRDAGGKLLLARGRSAGRDQSYFLCGLHGPSVLGRVLFPLGERDKIEARNLARRGGLAVEGKKGSQEVCFMAGASLKAFVTGRIPLSPGKIENTRGEIIGDHKGLALYTVGQRRKLGIATGTRQYVVGMDAIRNVLIVGGKEDLLRRELRCTLSWLDESALADGNGISAQIRSRHPAAPLREMDIQEDACRVTFAEPQSALTPGQTIAFYKGDLIVGSGVIDAAGPL